MKKNVCSLSLPAIFASQPVIAMQHLHLFLFQPGPIFCHVKFGREYISVWPSASQESEYVQISLDELFLPECLCTFVRTVFVVDF